MPRRSPPGSRTGPTAKAGRSTAPDRPRLLHFRSISFDFRRFSPIPAARHPTGLHAVAEPARQRRPGAPPRPTVPDSFIFVRFRSISVVFHRFQQRDTPTTRHAFAEPVRQRRPGAPPHPTGPDSFIFVRFRSISVVFHRFQQRDTPTTRHAFAEPALPPRPRSPPLHPPRRSGGTASARRPDDPRPARRNRSTPAAKTGRSTAPNGPRSLRFRSFSLYFIRFPSFFDDFCRATPHPSPPGRGTGSSSSPPPPSPSSAATDRQEPRHSAGLGPRSASVHNTDAHLRSFDFRRLRSFFPRFRRSFSGVPGDAAGARPATRSPNRFFGLASAFPLFGRRDGPAERRPGADRPALDQFGGAGRPGRRRPGAPPHPTAPDSFSFLRLRSVSFVFRLFSPIPTTRRPADRHAVAEPVLRPRVGFPPPRPSRRPAERRPDAGGATLDRRGGAGQPRRRRPGDPPHPPPIPSSSFGFV